MVERAEMLERIAKRALQLFTNGNISDALEAISELPPAAAAWVGGYVLFHSDSRALSYEGAITNESFWMRCLASEVVSKDGLELPEVEHGELDEDHE